MKPEFYGSAEPASIIYRPIARANYYGRFGKRMLDMVLAAFFIVGVAPLLVVLYALVRLDGGPGIFAHERVGLGGKTFKCYKLRTMCVDAREQLRQHLAKNPHAAIEWQETQKLAHDPRVTKIGRFLRKTSLDELPQFFNVLLGDMSLVGPRPVVEEELKRYGQLRDLYLSMKPGVTGEWQIFGRENGCYEERRGMDQKYANELSMLRDLELILRTSLVIFKLTGR